MVRALVADLVAEQDDLDAIVSGLRGPDWDTATPAEPWTVRDQIFHLSVFDARAVDAVTNPEAFGAHRQLVAGDLQAFVDADLVAGRRLPVGELLQGWRTARRRLRDVLVDIDTATRIPWYGPDMGARSFASARLMETWAHGQDVVDALGVVRPATDRLRHVAHLGVLAFPWSFAVRRRVVPAERVRVILEAPSGGRWAWNEEWEDNEITGPGLDFCLVATRRRHHEDTRLTVTGPLARQWIEIAQAFAGPPGPGRRPGMFRGDSE